MGALIALLAGLIFGLGLLKRGMIDPAKVPLHDVVLRRRAA
jgi:hypothetical protein